MIRKGIINRINRYARNRGLEITEIREISPSFQCHYKFNRIEFYTDNGSRFRFCEMDCDKRLWFIV